MALPDKPKIDLSQLNDEERKLFSLYGKLPQKKGALRGLQTQPRKYFDSGDYNMSKAGKHVPTGKEHPSPETIPHVSPPTNNTMGGLTGTSPTGLSTSPMKESGLAKEPDLIDPNESLIETSA